MQEDGTYTTWAAKGSTYILKFTMGLVSAFYERNSLAVG